MSQIDLKNSFVELGKFLNQFSLDQNTKNKAVKNNEEFFEAFEALIALSQSHNGWFTPEQVYFSIQSWAEALTDVNLTKWLSAYEFKESEPKKIGLILAGNIPLVGFHDFLTVLITGNTVLVKTSTNDQHLIKFLAQYLISIDVRFEEKITFVEGKLENFDAIIATGSNNTSRYFDYYFKDVPSIIRKNRNSVAILNGKESGKDLENLGEDIFRYFGLGCRNVSKLFVPKEYDFKVFFESIYKYKDVIFYEKYANNYDYNKAVFLMSLYKLLDNEFLTLKEDTSYSSPISSVFYEFYDDLETLKTRLKADENQIQCIVSNDLVPSSISFGQTQKPMLWDYADSIDTIEFLNSL